MRILWINPVGTDVFDLDTLKILEQAKRNETIVDVVSLPPDRPDHLEYHAYEGLVVADIVRLGILIAFPAISLWLPSALHIACG